MSSQTILAFDVYGTLLSTDSIAQELAKHLGEDNASTVAAAWRRHQLEYTWLLNSMSALSSCTDLNDWGLIKIMSKISTLISEPSPRTRCTKH